MGETKQNCNGDCAEKLSPDTCDDSGDEEIHPRIGDEYQAEVPSLSLNSDYACATGSPNLLVGLSIPVIWINEDPCSLVFAHGSSCMLNEMGCISKGNQNAQEEQNLDIDIKFERKCCPVPGVVGDQWSEMEEAGFLLGLYVFGKNLVQVRKFVGTKAMGDVLSFYYGRFYKSEKYRRWSECRKLKSRKTVHGQRIFTGVRQHEFVSRLLPHLSSEDESYLLKISKSLGDGKMLLEEYVNKLKCLVGMDIFIQSVGIGVPKKDLTANPAEVFKSNPTHPRYPDFPVKKASSSLTTVEILKFLTGDFRLSKSRSHELFWEAVWPRLLARGWHSEQPKRQECRKNSLVFLIPGIKKFSRRKLVKGIQYFDCVSDVLTKVSSEPVLLEIEDANASTCPPKTDQEHGSSSTHAGECDLQPRIHEAMKFTVVDTSLKNGGKFKLREFTSLPFDISDSTESDSSSTAKEPEVTSSNRGVIVNSYRRRGKKCRTLMPCNGAETSHSTISSSSGLGVKLETSKRCSPEKASSGSSSAENRTMIDLNLPQLPPEFAQHDVSDLNTGTGRRHSTRNRPLTARALEALAYDYLSVSKKRKRCTRDCSVPKQSRSVLVGSAGEQVSEMFRNLNVEDVVQVDPLLCGPSGLY